MKKILEILIDNVVYIIFAGISLSVFFSMRKRENHHKEAKKLVAKAVSSGLNEPMSLHPEIDSALCAGCGVCTKVCPEGDILKMINHKAVLVSPTKCVGHGECERACPFEAIKLVFGTKTRGMDIPRLSSNYETNVPGLYIEGELGGMGLIRNAIKQGVLAGKDAISKMSTERTDYDLLIVGAGPAGLAASLTAIAEKKSYLCIEQSSFGGTIFNFPRQKVVMSHPFDLPIIGEKKFNSHKVSKEELLDYWSQVQKKTGFKIQEQTKFENLQKKGNVFAVTTSRGVVAAKKVILCMGVRGSPRKLGVPGEDSAKVTYNLLDPEQYQQKNIVVVGGGNAGVEAAQMLADAKWNNKTHLLVRSGAFDRCNEDNIRRITNLQKNGQVEIWFNSSVQEILDKNIRIIKDGQQISLANDFVFVFAGAEMPHKFLMGLGVQIDKKFAEGLG